jgi:sugar fermentation stimulation protein A
MPIRQSAAMASVLDGGAYLLLIRLQRDQRLEVGKLGKFGFAAGYYIYVGSAMKNLRLRVERHTRRQNKTLHWHIDYLLTNRFSVVELCKVYPATERRECIIMKKVQKLKRGRILIERFGSSDCRSGCGSHLIYFLHRPRLSLLKLPFTKDPF